MADLIDFDKFLARRKEQQGFLKWAQNHGQGFEVSTRIRDLSDEVLLKLAEGGADGNAMLDHLIMEVWGVGDGDVRELAPHLQLQLLDLSLFLIDQFRFECMNRLEWINPLSVREIPLVDLIALDDEERKSLCRIPCLKEGHAHFHHFQKMLDLEKETFVRRQIPAALEQFRGRLKSGS